MLASQTDIIIYRLMFKLKLQVSCFLMQLQAKLFFELFVQAYLYNKLNIANKACITSHSADTMLMLIHQCMLIASFTIILRATIGARPPLGRAKTRYRHFVTEITVATKVLFAQLVASRDNLFRCLATTELP